MNTVFAALAAVTAFIARSSNKLHIASLNAPAKLATFQADRAQAAVIKAEQAVKDAEALVRQQAEKLRFSHTFADVRYADEAEAKYAAYQASLPFRAAAAHA